MSNPKNGKLNGVFQNNINTNIKQNDQEVPMEEEKTQKLVSNCNNINEITYFQTMSSANSLDQKDLLNTSNNIDLDLSDANKTSKSKQNDALYSFAKEYFDELYLNLILDEKDFFAKINCDYMSMQDEINNKMRAILVDWIVEVHFKFNMNKKTLFTCIFIIDAFLSKKNIERTKFQLLGMAALLIACKLVEITYPSIQIFLALSEFSYNSKELIKMEKIIIKELNFDVLPPTAEEFFEINSQYFNFTEEQKFFGEYFLDISLVEYNLLKYKQSTIAVACGYIVMKYYKLNGTNLILGNTYKDVSHKNVKDCVKELYCLMKNLSKSSLQAIKNKYMSDKFKNVAKLAEDI